MSTKIMIVIPAGGGRYDAMCDGNLIVANRREPLFAAARVMLAKGEPPDTVLVMRHAGSAIDSMSGKVGKLAKLGVRERGNGHRIVRFQDVTEPPPVHSSDGGATPIAPKP